MRFILVHQEPSWEIPSPDNGDYAKKVYKKAEKDFLKMYAGTIWEKAFKEKKALVCGENN